MRYYFKVGCDVNNLRSIRTFMRESLSKEGVQEDERDLIVLAVDEICSNKMLHGNANNNQKQLQLELDVQDYRVQVAIKDPGSVYHHENYVAPSLEDLVRDQRKGGMGMILVKKIMDEIEFFSENDLQVCRLIKRLQMVNL